MAHLKKFTKAAVGHMFKHYERAKDVNGEYVKFGNESIDPSRTQLNYNLAPDRGVSQGEFVRRRCQEVYCMDRKDVNVMCSWVVTMPKDLNPDLTKDFMQHTYNFLAKRYGEENVVSAYVHMDETTPHMHFAFVPVTYDLKKERYKVSACQVVSRNELRRFHGELETYLTKELGCEVNMLNEATKEGNRSIDELKKGTAIKELRRLESEIAPLRELRVAAEEVNVESKKLPFGNALVKQQTLDVIEQQAKAYAVNRNELETLREREANVSQREEMAELREAKIEDRAELIDFAYMRQQNLNELLNAAEDKIKEQETDIAALKAAEADLRQKNNGLEKNIADSDKRLKMRLKMTYRVIQDIVQAIGLLNNTENDYRLDNLTPKQAALIDALADYAAAEAEKAGFNDIAADLKSYVGLSPDIKAIADDKALTILTEQALDEAQYQHRSEDWNWSR